MNQITNTYIVLKNPIKGFVKKHYLYNLAKKYEKELVNGKIVSFSSYKNEKISFTFKVNNGALFHNLPLNSFQFKEKANADLSSLRMYETCPDWDFVIFILPVKRVNIFNKEKSFVGVGEYICSFDWIKDNELVHLIKYEEKLIVSPSHKVLFDSDCKILPEYKKQRY